MNIASKLKCVQSTQTSWKADICATLSGQSFVLVVLAKLLFCQCCLLYGYCKSHSGSAQSSVQLGCQQEGQSHSEPAGGAHWTCQSGPAKVPLNQWYLS